VRGEAGEHPLGILLGCPPFQPIVVDGALRAVVVPRDFLVLRENFELHAAVLAVSVDLDGLEVAPVKAVADEHPVGQAVATRHFEGDNACSFSFYNSVLITMETFRGRQVIIPLAFLSYLTL